MKRYAQLILLLGKIKENLKHVSDCMKLEGQDFQVANDCEKLISLSKFFVSGGEVTKWRTGLTILS